MVERLDIRTEFNKIKEMYESKKGANFSALIMGLGGVGKTLLMSTARKPVLVDQFDPFGAVVLKPWIDKGEVLVRDWSGDKTKTPTKYREYERVIEKDCQTGFLSNFGTYAIDSATTLLVALSNEIGKTFPTKEKMAPGSLAQGAYQPLYATVRDLIGMCSNQGCDFFLTSHIELDKDEVSGEVLYQMSVFKGLKTQIPLLFSERYCLDKSAKGDEIEYKLYTNVKGRFKLASSRLAASGKFDVTEEPNIKKLLKKAGYPTEDKPLFL
ncbi:conserved hypothetical protein [Azospirillaceae bacterium]